MLRTWTAMWNGVSAAVIYKYYQFRHSARAGVSDKAHRSSRRRPVFIRGCLLSDIRKILEETRNERCSERRSGDPAVPDRYCGGGVERSAAAAETHSLDDADCRHRLGCGHRSGVSETTHRILATRL